VDGTVMSPTDPAPATSDARPRRADARRNRDTILDTAREAFAEGGSAISMAEVARRSGVGMATLYRNFPNRQALLEALYLGNVQELARSADDLADAAPWDALVTWLRRFAAYFATKQALATELLDYGDGTTPVFTESRKALFAAAQPLLDRAQRAGDVRADVTLDQVMDMTVGIAKIPAPRPDHVDDILTIALDGLRTR
jgi:AcrR family transcriptional regulator